MKDNVFMKVLMKDNVFMNDNAFMKDNVFGEA